MSEKINKTSVIGFCSRLPMVISRKLLAQELAAIPADYWGGTGGRVGVQSQAEAIFLRGYAPAEGDKPIEDREILNRLKFIKVLIKNIIPARPQRCLLARLKAGGVVDLHVDKGEYFQKHIRIHFPIQTNKDVFMLCGNQAFTMAPGEIWALNNSEAKHGVLNRGKEPRTHMICDYEPSDALLTILANGDRNRGVATPKLTKEE